MHPIHVEPIDWLPSGWLVPRIQRPKLPGGEVVSESMLLVFADSIKVFRGESDLRMDLIEVLGGISLTGNWTNCSENIRPGRLVSKMAWLVDFRIIFREKIGASVISTLYRGST